MAFEKAKFSDFYQLLRDTVQNSHPEERAVAENFLLEERLTEQRENSYTVGTASIQGAQTWKAGHWVYISEKINVYSGIPETFTHHNESNLFAPIDEDQYLVRLENINKPSNITGRTINEVVDYLSKFLQDRGNSSLTSIIDKFLTDWNRLRDFRPMFAGFWGDVKNIFTDENGDMVENDNWANQLRDRFGLGHFDPHQGEYIPVILMRYRVRDIIQAHSGMTRIIAVPTILDSDWGPFFFPTPVNGWKEGQTLDLSPGDENGYSLNFEIIHRFIPYQPSYIFRAGWITTSPGKTCEEARKMHLKLFRESFRNFNQLEQCLNNRL